LKKKKKLFQFRSYVEELADERLKDAKATKVYYIIDC
jgi:hypothetical protein